jgi:hypothetical protein
MWSSPREGTLYLILLPPLPLRLSQCASTHCQAALKQSCVYDSGEDAGSWGVMSRWCMQVQGTLSVKEDLPELHLEVGQLRVDAHGIFQAGTLQAPHIGALSLRLNASLVDTCTTVDTRPTVDVHGTLSFVAPLPPHPNWPARVTISDAPDMISDVDDSAMPQLVAGDALGIQSAAGLEVARVKAVSSSNVTLAAALSLAHKGDATMYVLSRRMKIAAVGAPGLLRAWNGASDVFQNVQIKRGSHRRVHLGNKETKTPGYVQLGHQQGRHLRHASVTIASGHHDLDELQRCAGGSCRAPFLSSLPSTANVAGALLLHALEIEGFGEEGSAALHLLDYACAERWPAQPRKVVITGCTLHGLKGQGLALDGCLSHLQVRRHHKMRSRSGLRFDLPCRLLIDHVLLHSGTVSVPASKPGMPQ